MISVAADTVIEHQHLIFAISFCTFLGPCVGFFLGSFHPNLTLLKLGITKQSADFSRLVGGVICLLSVAVGFARSRGVSLSSLS
ncbi:hypothetical protein QBC34DRAFT_102616 [Podospora aff. communis PSN243]|uniref:Major facilitator superfamily (MFS) profile domain-containing protein n=1 Tax=Podospora aff. communis PSN243 TaxID=3040156 RepID=A0AAV9GKW9_9PEZI|nr:hypothetical protein QBC34DRAFT_102616 [Podospora aff. communis PSN243]